VGELTTEVMAILRCRYGLEIRSVVALVGGYDIWAESWQVDTDRGLLVVRVDRSISAETSSWLGDVLARAASAGVPCAALMLTVDGTTAVVADGATVTVRPFADGVNLDRNDPTQVAAAGVTLGRLHQALRDEASDRPTPSPWAARFWLGDLDSPGLRDPSLDAWNEGFVSGEMGDFSMGVVHGDFWADNIVWGNDRVVAVIDWSEARLDSLARELAWATWEFGHDEAGRLLDIDRVVTFLGGYSNAAGRWEPGLEDVFIPLMRLELRLNARYSLADAEDVEYNAGLQQAFVRLRSQSTVPLFGPASSSGRVG